MIKKIILMIYLCCFAVGSPFADSTKTVRKSQTLHIVNWNVQTFFDGEVCGTEYDEFKSSKSKWSRDFYIQRLDRLCEVIKTLDADVYVFEEIENSSVMYDISNRLSSNAWNKKKMWKYSCFAKTKDDALGCAILSRFPLSNMKTHSLDIRCGKEQPSMRPIIEVTLTANNNSLTIFVNHWKSKLGGVEETEIWRNWQESVLGNLFANTKNKATIACGDFNRDINDFLISNNNDVAFRSCFTQSPTLVKSAWLLDDVKNQNMYSYYYKDEGSCIDHFFVNEEVEIIEFKTQTSGAWANENCIPIRYEVFSGKGYSDHLPLSAIIRY